MTTKTHESLLPHQLTLHVMGAEYTCNIFGGNASLAPGQQSEWITIGLSSYRARFNFIRSINGWILDPQFDSMWSKKNCHDPFPQIAPSHRKKIEEAALAVMNSDVAQSDVDKGIAISLHNKRARLIRDRIALEQKLEDLCEMIEDVEAEIKRS